MATWIKQGDSYSIPVQIAMNGEGINPDDIEAVEFYLGNVRKMYPGEVEYSPEDECFYLPVTQKETLGFTANDAVPLDLRVKLLGGNVVGPKSMQYVTVYDATSEAVI